LRRIRVVFGVACRRRCATDRKTTDLDSIRELKEEIASIKGC
jgi:hypothetical protein